MAKRSRSPAQRRATKKLVAFNKRRGKPRSKARKRSKSSSKANKPKRRSSNMAKRRKSSGKSRGSAGFINKIPFLKNKTVQRVGFGLGMGSIATLIAGLVPVPAVQNNRQLIGTGVSFATDPLSGVVRLALSGGLGQITSLFGGGSNDAVGGGVGNQGFA